MASLILRMNEGDAAVNRGVAGLHAETGFAIVLESALAGKNEELANIKENSAQKCGEHPTISLA